MQTAPRRTFNNPWLLRHAPRAYLCWNIIRRRPTVAYADLHTVEFAGSRVPTIAHCKFTPRTPRAPLAKFDAFEKAVHL